jgi:uncharacterized protein
MKRACVDTNVIIRFISGDPPELAEKARVLFRDVQMGKTSLYLPEIVLAEAVWVLQSFYEYSGYEVAKVLQELIGNDGFVMADKANMLLALNLYAEKKIDFADAVVAVEMIGREIKEVYSFDEHFDRLDEVARIVPGE